MTPDFDKAAVLASETLVRYGVRRSPVSPLPILEQMDNVITVSFSSISDSSGISRKDLIPMFGKSQDAVTSFHAEGGVARYVVAYNSLLPFNMVQRALAREMGHIVLKHKGSSPENTEEAMCFAKHLLCPRPLIHAVQAIGMRFTVDLLANLTGIFDQALLSIRHTPGTHVSPGLNRFVRSQFMPFILNFFQFYQTVMPKDGSAIADLGTYMDNYEE